MLPNMLLGVGLKTNTFFYETHNLRFGKLLCIVTNFDQPSSP